MKADVPTPTPRQKGRPLRDPTQSQDRLHLVEPAPGSAARYDLDDAVEGLRLSRDETHSLRPNGRVRPMPSRATLGAIVDDLSAALFPSHFGQSESGVVSFDAFVRGTLATALILLEEQVRRGLSFAEGGRLPPEEIDRRALAVARGLGAALPEMRGTLVADLHAALDGDPTASSTPEILLGHPGMAALLHHRIAHALDRLGAGLPARLVADIARTRTAIDIHPSARLGEGLHIDHGAGLVIEEGTSVGRGVRLHQNVTLGSRAAPSGPGARPLARGPTIEDGVTVEAGASVLGAVTVGRGSVVGAGVCLTASVPAGSRVAQASAHRAR